MVAIVVAFALVGTFAINASHASPITPRKDPGTGCYLTAYYWQMPTLRYGSTGGCVTYVQEMLNLRYGYLNFKLKEDGIYGPSTTNAVKFFQGYKQITVDGVTGPQTWFQLVCGGPYSGSTIYTTGCWGS